MVFGLVSIAYLECQKLFGHQEDVQQEQDKEEENVDLDVNGDVSVDLLDVRFDADEESGDADQFKSLEVSFLFWLYFNRQP